MVNHQSTYSSHKHGYASDGITVRLKEARSIDKKKYLSIVIDKEKEMLDNVVNNLQDKSYNNVDFPDCAILTPYVLVSLPRNGRIEYSGDFPSSWNDETRLTNINEYKIKGSFLTRMDILHYDEAPFDVNLSMNSQLLDSCNPEKTLDEISRQVEIISSRIPLVKPIIDSMNNAHNKMSYVA